MDERSRSKQKHITHFRSICLCALSTYTVQKKTTNNNIT
ncbi:unnamed protein product [Amoebophrya sp. A25]|nr:unnamed protein product [Amoebophrya sp. A25]|eukprot:GSA25T00013138001.1